MDSIPVMNQRTFSLLAEERALDPGVSYIDGIIDLCENYHLEITDVKKFMTRSLHDKVEAEAIGLNYIKGGNTLPL